ncbi:dihydrolipoamide acetyltransferase family protein [Labrys sp. ZIDIC5]|uniref:dihydrolipoamide acetyltransferase family protein n=1 Tax=Labrys sedimenti TaxID=3106036 RepID=UPI002ACAB44A|nr:dihydrolipoamide acetyltransferase family protein [Labrys sp. ZIDIC5]MDZ5448866.1 dihydrolipoamide acetyltransferase family protein [Labrys sp. ZIDIC5]
MSNFVFKLPDVGEGIAQAEIVAWHAEIGQEIQEDDPLVDVMTDKATVEITSPVSGRILSRHAEVGVMASIGSELVVIDTGGKAEASAGEPVPAPASAPAKPSKAPAKAAQAPAQAAAPAAVSSPPAAPAGSGKVLAAPAVRARLAALGLDGSKIHGSGPEGRIEHADLDDYLTRSQSQPQTMPSAQLSRPPVPPPPAFGDDGIEEIKVIGLRRQIAERMLEAKRSVPHFTYVEEIDVTALEAARAEINTAAVGWPKLTLLPFLIKAMVRGIAQHPIVNARYDAEAAVIHRYNAVHIGVATQTPRGLVVPVIRHAEMLTLHQLAAEIAKLSELARAGKASREVLTGSTITVSSLGALGGIAATPIINPPEVAIVGVNKIVERPVVKDGQIVVAKLMNLSSSFDHRIVDGFDAAAFIKTVKGELEAPVRLMV